LGDVQNVVDQTDQVPATLHNVLHGVLLATGEVVQFQQLSEAQHRIERCRKSWLMRERNSLFSAFALARFSADSRAASANMFPASAPSRRDGPLDGSR